MSENGIVMRDAGVIAREINFIKEQTKRQMLAASMEIGARLCEAKELVGHGEWEKWLCENVDYSQSTANNLMRIYREYGSQQINLLTGKAPVSALEREAEVANQKMRTGMQQIKASLADVLEEAMALNPDDRYADMQSFCEALKKEIPIAEGAKPIERTVYFDREKEGRKILPQWKKKRLYLGCGILALILVMVIAGKTMLSGTQKEKAAMAEKTPLATKAVTPSPTQALVTMPDVVGKETSDAIAAVRTMDANIAIIIERGYSEKKKETVYRQSIKPGLQYTAGDKKEVILHISLGIKRVRVPNVTGKTLTEAKAVLSARGLKYTVKKQFSNSRKNSIIKQSRKKNVKVKEGTVIHLTVSRGEKKVSLASIQTRKPEPVATKKPKKIQIVTD